MTVRIMEHARAALLILAYHAGLIDLDAADKIFLAKTLNHELKVT